MAMSSHTTSVVNTTGSSTGTSNSRNNNSAATTTTMVAGGIGCGGGGTLRRIRTPTPQDVLSGRGGGINSHPGNKVFREWVRLRKEDYNLARNKKEKTVVATEVVRQVQEQNGRFLTKDTSVVGGSGGHWWVEIDETKALAKTTQALREGAPKIRMAHQLPEDADTSTTAATTTTTSTTTSTGKENKTIKKRKRKNSCSSEASEVTHTSTMDESEELEVTLPALPYCKSEQLLLPATDYTMALEKLHENVEKAKYLADHQDDQGQEKKQEQQQVQEHRPMNTLVAPLTSNKDFNARYRSSNRFNPLAMSAVDPFADTPPLTATPEPDFGNEIPSLSLDVANLPTTTTTIAPPPPLPRKTKLQRNHSLSLSDYGDGMGALSNTNLSIMGSGGVEFVNPFADESSVYASENDTNVVSSFVPSSITNQWSGAAAPPTAELDTSTGNLKQSQSNISVNHTESNNRWNRLLSLTALANDDDDDVHSDDVALPRIHNDENSYSDYFFHDDGPLESDFGEGMKSILDVVHPDLTSPVKDDDSIPTLLMPWRGDKKNTTMKRRTSFSSRNSLSRGSLNNLIGGRQ